jgi:tRNA threonylcarbamoyladenosine biosynthesis protein TsaE
MPTAHASFVVPTADAMRTLGARLALLLRAGDLAVLTGDLGAGKTTLTQGIGTGLGVREMITSPTFVIARVHPSLVGGPDLVHVDAYRLGSLAEIDDLDLDASLQGSVTVVEWGEGLVEDLAPDRLEVLIRRPRGDLDAEGRLDLEGADGDDYPDRGADQAPSDGDENRHVMITGFGDRWDAVSLPTSAG